MHTIISTVIHFLQKISLKARTSMETLCQMFLFLFLKKKQLNKAADFLTFLFFRMYWKSFRGLKTKFSITYISWCPYQHFGKDGKKHSYVLPMKYRSSSPEVSLGKDHLKICSKFTRKHPWRSVFSIKVACNFIETALRHGFSWMAAWGLQLYYKRDSGTGGFLWILRNF